MKRALLYVYLDTHFIELARVAEVLQGDGYECVFLFAYRYPAVDADIARSAQAGWRGLDERGAPLDEAGRAAAAAGAEAPPAALDAAPRLRRLLTGLMPLLPGPLRRLAGKLAASLRELSPWQLVLSAAFPRLGLFLGHLRNQENLARSIVTRVSPSVIVLPEDNIEYLTGALIRAGHAQGIGSVIVPYTIANAEEIAEAYWHNPDFSVARWRNRLAGWLYPRWVYEHRGRKLIPLPADRIVAMEQLGFAPPLPWIINSGDADALATESPFMRRYYEEAGLPPRQLVVTGALYDDVVFRQLAAAGGEGGGRRLRAELGLDPRKPLLLCALPPDQYRSGRPGAEFDSYERMVRAWAAALVRASEYAVLIRLHPRTLRSEVPWLEGEYGLRITDRDTASLIPHCDVFLASVSATIRVAIACGKPVINYDCYRFRYRDFGAVPGVRTVEDAAGFEGALRELARDDARAALAARQRDFAASANVMDGRAHERVLGLINSLARRS